MQKWTGCGHTTDTESIAREWCLAAEDGDVRAFGVVVGAAAAGWAAFVRVNYGDVRAVGAGSTGSAGNGVEGVAASSGWSSRCWGS